jgi:hypothetical protein
MFPSSLGVGVYIIWEGGGIVLEDMSLQTLKEDVVK